MKYMGSKRRIAKDILPIILDGRRDGQYYVEPFCGGCNSLEHVTGPRIGGDYNKYIIAMWQGLQKQRECPQTVTEQMYKDAREDFRAGTNWHYDDFMIGWIGALGSFNGVFFNGYCGNYPHRDYIGEQARNIAKQMPRLMDVEFHYCSYQDLHIPDRSIIYCDIPYRDTAQYAVSRGFDHDRFWAWCHLQKKGDTQFS